MRKKKKLNQVLNASKIRFTISKIISQFLFKCNIFLKRYFRLINYAQVQKFHPCLILLQKNMKKESN